MIDVEAPDPIITSPNYGVLVKLCSGRILVVSKADADLLVERGAAVRSWRGKPRDNDWERLGQGNSADE